MSEMEQLGCRAEFGESSDRQQRDNRQQGRKLESVATPDFPHWFLISRPLSSSISRPKVEIRRRHNSFRATDAERDVPYAL
jgi:hypothetical protein